MFKLYRKFSKLDLFVLFLIVCFTVLQVFITMTLVDFVQGIIKAITYANYHNNPELLGLPADVDWSLFENVDGVNAFFASLGIPVTEEAASTLVTVSTASSSQIWYNGLMMLLMAGLVMLVQAINAFFAAFLAANLSTRIRKSFYEKVSEFSLEEIDKFSTASLVTRATNDIQHIQFTNLMTFRMIFQAPVTMIWAIVKMQASSFELSMTTIVAIIILIFMVIIVMVLVIPKFKVVQKTTDAITNATRDNLIGVRVIRAFNAEGYQQDKFDTHNNKLTKLQLFTGRVTAILSPFMSFILNGLTLAMYTVGAHLINRGDIDYASVVSFVMLSTQVVMAFLSLLFLLIMWPRALVAAGRLNEVLETKINIVDPEVEQELKEVGTVEFKNVYFKYPTSDNPALLDISFKVNKGETLAIIGATSSGKTTLINLISRLYDVTSGEVLVDGVNVKDIKQKTLRDHIGYVPQKGFLFNTSIKENIAFGHDEIDEERVRYAARVACADSFIEEKEDKYEYKITQTGKNVSGGQRQRLCIARCVYNSPEIYIFDDSFSALDYKTDKKLRTNLNELDKDATKIIVAQRIGTIMEADKIIVLDSGKIVDIGTHQELLNSSKIYREIAVSQLSEKELGL